MKLLLFGVTGLLGTEFERSCERHPMVLVGLSHEDIDVRDLDSVRSVIVSEQPDAVINLVAIPSIDLCEKDPDLAFSVHVTAPLNMIKTCAKLGSVYVQASSHAVFDGTKIDPYTEHDQPNPASVYAASKYVSERLAANLCSRHYIVRFATMYGRRRNNAVGFIDKVVRKLRNGEELRIADDKIDSPTYARDAAEVLMQILIRELDYGIYHIANTGTVSYFEFVCALSNLLGLDNPIHRAKDRDFPSLGFKPLRTALRSVRLDDMRPWQDALMEYVNDDILCL